MSIRRRIPARPANAVNPAIPEMIEAAVRGRASLFIDNPHGLDDTQVDLVYRLHRAASTTSGIDANAVAIGVTARAVATLGAPIDSRAASAELRRLAGDTGLVKIEKHARGLTYRLESSLEEILPFSWATTDCMHDAKHREDTLRVFGLNQGAVSVGRMNGYTEGRFPIVDMKSLASVGRSVAVGAIDGESSFGVVDASGGYGPDDRSVLVLTPYRFAKGRRQEPFVAIKNLPMGRRGGAGFSWRGSSIEATSFDDHVVRAEDLRDLCSLLTDPHKAAAPVGLRA